MFKKSVIHMGTMIDNFESLIIDMDGVLWRENVPIGDLGAIFSRIREHKLSFLFATNNGSRTPGQYVERLAEFGVEVDERQVITSALGVAQMLKGRIPNGSPVFVIGEEGTTIALRNQGFEIASIEAAGKSQAVVMGIDHGINFEKMREATLLVRRGIPFYATNPDKTFPTPRGEIPGAGAWISVIVTATGIEPKYAGKPYPYMMEMALDRLGTSREQTLVVGDRLETDIAAGQAAGCPTALVLSGVSTRAQAEAWHPRPSIIVQDLESLVK
jgi:4-nitrophenyl phosphatase